MTIWIEDTYTNVTLYLHYIAKYISSVLANFTTASGSFDREGYFKNTYIHNADVYGGYLRHIIPFLQ